MLGGNLIHAEHIHSHTEILARYSGEYTIFRELLQNADDANAKSVKIRFLTSEGSKGSLGQDRELPELLKVPVR
jgi:hypothetical protein